MSRIGISLAITGPKTPQISPETQTYLGDRKSLPIAKNHPKPSMMFLDKSGLLFTKSSVIENSHEEVHPNFAKTWEEKFLKIPP